MNHEDRLPARTSMRNFACLLALCAALSWHTAQAEEGPASPPPATLPAGAAPSSPAASQTTAATSPFDESIAAPVGIEEDAGFFTLSFPILKQERKAPPGTPPLDIYYLAGKWNGKLAGVTLLVVDDWEKRMPDDSTPLPTSWSEAALLRPGPIGDHLLHALAALWHRPVPDQHATAQVLLTIVSLAGKPDAPGQKVKLKAIIEGGSKEDYAEFYLNIDEAQHTVEVKEKDPAYRPALLRALAAKAAPTASR